MKPTTDQKTQIKRTHKDLVEACLILLTVNGFAVWKQNTGAAKFKNAKGETRFVRFSKVGVSDIIGWTPDGLFCAVEVKIGKDVLKEEQEKFLEDVHKVGGFAYEARNDVEGLRRAIWKYQKRRLGLNASCEP